MQSVIDSLTHGVPTLLIELDKLGRTLKRRASDILAFFDRPGTSNGQPKRSTGVWNTYVAPCLGFRNLTNYITRTLLETGRFKPQPHPQMR